MEGKNGIRPKDLRNVNIHGYPELRYWTTRFECTRVELEAVVRKVGVKAADVEKELLKKLSRPTISEVASVDLIGSLVAKGVMN